MVISCSGQGEGPLGAPWRDCCVSGRAAADVCASAEARTAVFLAARCRGLKGCKISGRHDHAYRPHYKNLFSTVGHRPCCLALFQVSLDSLRLVEELLLERGIIVSYETIRRWSAEIRAGLRKTAPSQATFSSGHLASGRGGDFHPRPKTLALARR